MEYSTGIDGIQRPRVSETQKMSGETKIQTESVDIATSTIVKVATAEGKMKDMQLRFIQVNGIKLDVPLIDSAIGSSPSIEFQQRAQKLIGLLHRAQCSPDITGFLRSCGFEDARTSTGTSRAIYRKDQILSENTQIIKPGEFSDIMGITIERSNSSELSEYDSYRDTLHKARIYDNTRTFMTDVADWLTKIYKKSSK